MLCVQRPSITWTQRLHHPTTKTPINSLKSKHKHQQRTFRRLASSFRQSSKTPLTDDDSEAADGADGPEGAENVDMVCGMPVAP